MEGPPTSARSARVASGIAFLGLCALVLFLFRETLLEGRAFFRRDIHLMWLTQVDVMTRELAAGRLPLWNPFLSFGQPLLADANNQVLYPFTWLHLLLKPWRFYTALAVAHTLWSSVGMYLLARRFGLLPPSAWVASALWIASGPFLCLIDMWNQLVGASWIPWAALAADGLARPGWPARAIRLALILALQVFAGSPEAALASGAIAAGLTVTEVLTARTKGALARGLAGLALACTLAISASAAQWLPSLEVARRSQRADLPAEVRTYWSVHPWNLTQMVLPIPFNELPLTPAARALLFESREALFPSLYLGLPALGLVGAAFARRSPQRILLLVLLLGAIGLALGRHAPFYAWSSAVLPPLRVLRYPVKAMVVASFAWALLAGMGAQAWALERERVSWWARVVLPLGLTSLAGAALAHLLSVGGPGMSAWLALGDGPSPAGAVMASRRLAVTAAVGAMAALVAIFFRPGRRGASGAALLAGVLAVGDLLQSRTRTEATASPALFTHRPPAVDALGPRDGSRLYVYDYLVYGKSMAHLGRAVPFVVARAPAGWSYEAAFALALREYLFPPTGGVWGIEGSFDRDVTGLFSRELAQIGDLLRTVEGTPLHLKLLRLGAVGHVVALHTEGLGELEPVASFPGFFPEPIRVFRVPRPLPRTYVVGRAREAPGREALNALQDPAFDPEIEVVLDRAPLPPSASFQGASRLVHVQPDRLRLEAELSAPGYVVLVDAYDPDWKAILDGQRVPLLRANAAFRAIAAPAGHHVIEMRYAPASLLPGFALSGLSWVGAAAALLRSRSRSIDAE